MKCEKCGNKEANFHYRANINGEITERHLCSDCAREEGLEGAMNWRPRGFYGDPYAGMFGPYRTRPMMNNFEPFMTRRVFMPMFMLPVYDQERGYEPDTSSSQETGERAPHTSDEQTWDAGDEMRQRREISALRYQMANAVNNEDFEKAAELRDLIRSIEKN